MPRKGLQGGRIVDVQRRLRLLGYELGTSEIDGIMGPRTKDAVRKFQQDRGLVSTGAVDGETWQELVDAGYKIGDRLLYLKDPPFRGDDVKLLQSWLKTLGFYKSNENGIFCSKTRKALVGFQKDMKIHADGILGGETLQNLKNLKRIFDSHSSSNYPIAGDFERYRSNDGIKIIFDYGESISDLHESINFFKDKIYICKSIVTFCRDFLLHAGVDSAITVNEDDNLSLFPSDRIKFANRSNADILISLNLGYSSDTDANGSSCFYFMGAKSHSITGKTIANIIQDRLVENLDVLDCRVHGAGYSILKETVMTAVLVEPAFISNEKDRQNLNNTEFQLGISNSIIAAIKEFLRE
ncbi:MAG: hypothetical protein FJW66_01510 [Actinobacteria bacterium]|nr:hypothetical protein [Actinomycetota bacterium]